MDNYLEHHGILGQRWGIRRYQNYDGTLIKSGRSAYGKTRYTNIDGSLNERGKLRSQKFINKQREKNDKYYAKYEKKYDKLAKKYEDDAELSNKFKAMKDDAERTRKSVNGNIEKMNIDDVINLENAQKEKALKIASAVGLTAATAALPALVVSGANAAGKFFNEFDPATGMTKVEAFVNTPTGKKAQNYVDTSIRAYSDVNAYVFGIYADQMIKRMNEQGIPQKAGKMAGEAMNSYKKSTGESVANYTAEEIAKIYGRYL